MSMEHCGCVAVVVRGPLLEKEVGGGGVSSILETDPVLEDGEMDVHVRATRWVRPHRSVRVSPASNRSRTARDWPVLAVAGSAGG